MQDEVKNKPIKVFACSVVKASIWLNYVERDGEIVGVHSITIDKAYRDKADGTWQYSSSFSVDDLPRVAVVTAEAYKYLRLRSYENEDQNKDNVSNTRG